MQFILRPYRLLMIVSLISYQTNAQHFIEKEFTDHLCASKTQQDSLFLIKTNYPTTGMVLHLHADDSPEGSYIIVESDTFYFHMDMENISDEIASHSNLYTFPVPIDSFQFCPENIKHTVRFIFINAQMPKEKKQASSKKKSAGCSEPEMIDQSVWRRGLIDPDYIRIPNIVHNVIIHHSAGSNIDTNYIQVIRNIYIYHTEYLEWSDIAYNYLVAQDGTIFKGRDPGELEQDNVLGAHFCGSNTGTLGICVLGNYMVIAPPEDAIRSLIYMVTWKLGKDSLDSLGTYPHPLNPDLGVIAGHRNGCPTACPGDLLYNELIPLRLNVMESFNNCGYSIKPLEFQEEQYDELFFTISEGELIIYHPDLQIDQVCLYDLLGRKYPALLNESSDYRTKISIYNLKTGLNILSIHHQSSLLIYKIMIMQYH